MDSGGWNERDALNYSIRMNEKEIEELRKQVEDWKLKYETLFELLKENKFEEQNKNLRAELNRLYQKLKDQEKEYEEKIKIDEIERQLLDFIYEKSKIENYGNNLACLYLFVIPQPILYHAIFDYTIKEYFIKKGVKYIGDNDTL